MMLTITSPITKRLARRPGASADAGQLRSVPDHAPSRAIAPEPPSKYQKFLTTAGLPGIVAHLNYHCLNSVGENACQISR